MTYNARFAYDPNVPRHRPHKVFPRRDWAEKYNNDSELPHAVRAIKLVLAALEGWTDKKFTDKKCLQLVKDAAEEGLGMAEPAKEQYRVNRRP